jgi:uncharacterized protein YpmS
MVFQNIANYYLNSILSLYIKDYKSEQLNLQFGNLDDSVLLTSTFSSLNLSLSLSFDTGKAVLKDLYVKESAVNSLQLPIKLKHGYIENLRLKVNFNNFYNAQLSLEISDVYLVLLPNFSMFSKMSSNTLI